MEETLLFYTCLSLIFILLGFNLFFQTPKRRGYKNLPPSPPSLPIIGHLHLLKPPVYRTLHGLSKQYGDVFSLRFGSRRVVIVTSPAVVEECFTKNDVVLANRPPLLGWKYLSYNYTTVTQSPYGDHWRNLRRIGAIEIFSTARLNAFSGIRKDEIKRSLVKLSNNSVHDFGKVELQPMFTDLMLNIIMRMVAGKRYYGEDVRDKEEARKFKSIMNELSAIRGAANPGDFLPFLNWFGKNGYEKRVKRLAKRADAFLQGLIDEQRSMRGSKNTMIDHLLSLQESQPEYYTDQIIKGFVLVLLTAGTDTSSVMMEWVMSNLLNHPQVLKKAKDELDLQLGEGQEEHLVDESDVSKLHYLQGIISETFRLYPVTPLLVPHYSSDDCTIGGFDVSRDTIVLVNAWAIQRDPKLWDHPESFKPERFEVGESEIHKLVLFGLGRRACPGQFLAQRVIGLTLASLIQCFEWKRIGEEEVDMESGGKGITMPRATPLEAMCKARPIMKAILSKYESLHEV